MAVISDPFYFLPPHQIILEVIASPKGAAIPFWPEIASSLRFPE